jgi:hypothetical protein
VHTVSDINTDRDRHQKLLAALLDRLTLAENAVKSLAPTWDHLDDLYTGFRAVDDEDKVTQQSHKVSKIVVPLSFAIVQTIISVMFEVITSRVPMLPVTGREGSDVKPAQVMEAIISFQAEWNQFSVILYNWLQDYLKYGIGVTTTNWHTDGKEQTTTETVQSTQTFLGVDFPMEEQREKTRFVPTLETNKISVVDPYSFWRDPRWPLSRFQEGEFAGHRTMVSKTQFKRMTLLDNEQAAQRNESPVWINISEAMKAHPNSTDFSRTSESSRERFAFPSPYGASGNQRQAGRAANPVQLDYLQVDLIPNDEDWNVGTSSRPQKWLFVIANRKTIVQSRKDPSAHGLFSYAPAEPYPDAHRMSNMSVMEILRGLQEHLDFLFNSHMANVRKVINDMLLIDPSRVVMKDLITPNAGRLIRLAKTAYGTDPAGVVKQLQVTDVTQGHLGDAGHIQRLAEMVTGASGTLQGQPAAGRRSASEMGNALKAAAGRIRMMLITFQAMGITPMEKMMVSNTQEFMTMERAFRIVGEDFLKLPPEQLLTIVNGRTFVGQPELQAMRQANFEDFPAFDTALPQDRQERTKVMADMFKGISSNPMLFQVFDVVEMFSRIAKDMGVKDIRTLTKQTNIQVDNSALTGAAPPGANGAGSGPGPGAGRASPGQGTAEGREFSEMPGQIQPEIRG